MAARKTADDWFAAYGESHQHPTNELIHWICVPAIFACVLGFISLLPVPEALSDRFSWFNWTHAAIALASLFYLRLSPAIAAGMLAFMALCNLLLVVAEMFVSVPMWWIYGGVFVVAWIGQFIGHHVEGRRPSFLHDVVFLLIGPAWLLSRAYRKVGQKY
jgi:uncharacterized membrane protein YGL010W